MFVAVVRGERKNCFLLSCMIFLSRKIHLELLQSSLDKENDCSNFKKSLEKFCFKRRCWSEFLVCLFSKIGFREPIGDVLRHVGHAEEKKRKEMG